MVSMDTNNVVKDVNQLAERLMIDLFKQKIQETGVGPERLRGTWAEASNILRSHFRRVSRIMTTNQRSLHGLYRIAIKELKQV